jgi:hypothetical protein
MATPNRCTVTIDGTQFDALSANVTFHTAADGSGMPQMGKLGTDITVYVDMHDDQNLPNSTIQKFFGMANVVTRDKIKSMKIVYWKDDAKQDALVSYSFNGWISRFQTSNPMTNGDGGLNHLLVMDLQPAMNQQNFTDITLSN